MPADELSRYRTTAQLYAAGMSRRSLQGALTSGDVERARRGLYVMRGGELESTWRGRVEEALARVGPDAVVDRYSAARLLSIAGSPATAPLTLALPPSRKRQAAGVDILRTVVDECDTTIIAGMRVTRPLRTVVDCARFGERVCAIALIESAIRQGGVTAADVAARLSAKPRARGIRAARGALAHADPASESPLETAVRIPLLDAGLPRPVLQFPFVAGRVRGRIDLAYPADLLGGPPGGRYVGLAIEADGRAPHEDEATFHHDRVRHTALEEAGWLVRRFTDHHARRATAYMVGVVERAIAQVRAG